MSLVMKLIRTCSKKHYCRREDFNRNRAIYKLGAPGSGYEHRYEVWDTQCSKDPGWDDPSTTEIQVFSSDEKSECENYIGENGYRYEIRENGVCGVCDLYDQRKDTLAEGRVRPFYLVSYNVSRHYGGPEEGGWWYDWHTINEVRRAFTFEEGLRQARALKEKYPQPRYNRFSAANRGEGENYTVFCYAENDPRWPNESKERPRYE